MRRMLVLMGAGVAVLAVAGAAAQAVGYGTGSVVVPRLRLHGQGGDARRLPRGASILDARPDGVTPRGEREMGCDHDDALVSAGQSYGLQGQRADVLSFCPKAGLREGWTPSPEEEGEASSAWSGGPTSVTSTCRVVRRPGARADRRRI